MHKKYLLSLVGVIVLQSCQYQVQFPSFNSTTEDTSETSQELPPVEKSLKSIQVHQVSEPIQADVFAFELDQYELSLTYSDNSTQLIPISYGMLSSQDHLKLYGPGEHTLTLFYENLFTKFDVHLTFDAIAAELFNYYSLYFAEATQGTSYLRFREWRRSFIKQDENPIVDIYLTPSGSLFVNFLDGTSTNVGKAFSSQQALKGEFKLENNRIYWVSKINGEQTLLQSNEEIPELNEVTSIDELSFFIDNRMFYYRHALKDTDHRVPLVSIDALLENFAPIQVDILSIDILSQDTDGQSIEVIFDDLTNYQFTLSNDKEISLDLATIGDDGYWLIDGVRTSKLAKEPTQDYFLSIENGLLQVVYTASGESQDLIQLSSLNHRYDSLAYNRNGLSTVVNDYHELIIDAASINGGMTLPNHRIHEFELQIQIKDEWVKFVHLKELLSQDVYSRINLRISHGHLDIKAIESSTWISIIPLDLFSTKSGDSLERLAIHDQQIGLRSSMGDWQPIIALNHFIQSTEPGQYFITDHMLQWRGLVSHQTYSILDILSIGFKSMDQSLNFIVEDDSLMMVEDDDTRIVFASLSLFNPSQLPSMIANGFIQLVNDNHLLPIIELKSIIQTHENYLNNRAVQYQLDDAYVQWRNLGSSNWTNLLTTSLLSVNEAQLGYQRYLIENPSYFSTYDQWKLDVSSDFIIDPNARFHVRFMSEGVELETYESIVSGSRIDLLSPEKVGHTFLGWFMSESVHAAQFTDESVVQSQLTLYAKWSINRYKIEYFKDNAIVHTDYYYYGESLRLHPGLSKDGFAFIAWQNSLNLTISNQTMPAENLKLYAKFVAYDSLQSVDFLSANVEAGKVFTLPDMVYATTMLGDFVQVPVIWDRKTIQLQVEGAYIFFGRVNGYDGLAVFRLHVSNMDGVANMLSGYVNGLEANDKATVVISNRLVAYYTTTDAWGYYEFRNLPFGQYKMKIEIKGYQLQDPIDVTILNSIQTQMMRFARSPFHRIPQDAAIQHTLLEIERYELNHFFYEWRYGGDYFGYETTANIVPPTVIEFLNEDIIVNDSAASLILKDKFNVVLADSNILWTVEYANRLLDMIKRAPVPHNHPLYSTLSKWIIVDYFLPKDIVYSITDGHYEVYLSIAVFQHATPRLAEIEGKKGIVFSNRLYHALIRILTDEGRDVHMVQHILVQRFGVSLFPNYADITRFTTGEDATRFQPFQSEELLHILNMFEEMPKGLHKVEGLQYLVRRLNGLSHPIYPSAAAVAWPFDGANYIEFMEVAFRTVSLHDTYRLILHEKAHFLWAYTIKQSLKDVWIDLGGWYETTDTASGWASTKTTEFVSAYAHAINPNEDMAESIASYLLNPNALKAHALDKYYFIQNYVMSGTTYLAQIREDLTFEVFNLYPDYDYPGKINRVTVNITGAPEDDKLATIEIELNHIDGLQDGANAAIMRIYSTFEDENGLPSSTYFDLWLTPLNGNKHILKGYTTLSKYLKSGYWKTDQIGVFDQNGGTRYEGVHQFGFKFYLDNPLEDIVKPEYVKDSARMSVEVEVIDGRNFYRVTVSFQADEVNLKPFNGAYARIAHENPELYSFQSWGSCDVVTKICEASFLLSDFHPSGLYELREIFIVDIAENAIRVPFTKGESDEYVSLILLTLDEDNQQPELNLNAISISAVPTNPTAPNGETRVTITYYVRDDKSGLGWVYLRLMGPQGESFGDYHYHQNFHSLYYVGDPTAWTKYELILILPAGSSPGLWGLAEMTLQDKAGNRIVYNFLELLTFELID